MNLFLLVFNYLTAKPLNTMLNIFLMALGIAVITILLLFSNQLEQKITENTKGIDLVVGAKGSSLQIILCNIFHIDFPTGNIKLFDAEKLAKNPLIKKSIPLALGDSYQNFRIVGTNKNYPDIYAAELLEGNWWKENFESVVGKNVAEVLKLNIGDTFASEHGLGSGGHVHEENKFVVKGILQRTGNVLDNLILTNVESVWEVHEHENENGSEHEHHEVNVIRSSSLVPSIDESDTTKEITSLLIQYRSPLAAIQLPRFINSQSNLQSASPAFETARLFSILGIGVDILMSFAGILVFISALSIFIALYNSLKERQYDLAIMRSMGANRSKLFIGVLLEGSAITIAGSLLGLALAHTTVILFSAFVREIQLTSIDKTMVYEKEWFILLGSILLGAICSFIPAIQAYRVNIHQVLSQGK